MLIIALIVIKHKGETVDVFFYPLALQVLKNHSILFYKVHILDIRENKLKIVS